MREYGDQLAMGILSGKEGFEIAAKAGPGYEYWETECPRCGYHFGVVIHKQDPYCYCDQCNATIILGGRK